jgi:excinuclease ABC subunit C
MRAFGSVAAVRRASAEELQQVAGIGPQLALRIVAILNPDASDEMLAAEGTE